MRSGIHAAILLAASMGVIALTNPGLASTCAPVIVKLDSTLCNTGREPFSGRAVGQSFLAEDTIITRIKVWRYPGNASMIPAHLFVTEVDTTWTPPRPNTAAVLLDGPTLLVPDSDPPGQTIVMNYLIDPPLVLPRRGLYAFFLQDVYCNLGFTFAICASTANPYPHGLYWITNRVLSGRPCYLPSTDGGGDLDDLLFEIEYCRPNSTPTLRNTWGTLKARYR